MSVEYIKRWSWKNLDRLYPKIIDKIGIKTALVEARLCRSQGEAAAAPDKTMSTYYVELHPSPGGDRSI